MGRGGVEKECTFLILGQIKRKQVTHLSMCVTFGAIHCQASFECLLPSSYRSYPTLKVKNWHYREAKWTSNFIFIYVQFKQRMCFPKGQAKAMQTHTKTSSCYDLLPPGPHVRQGS